MENKTINQMNEKTWYRLLKVVYFWVFVITLIVGNFIIYEISKNYLYPKATSLMGWQVQANIDAMRQQGASINEIKGYVDSLSTVVNPTNIDQLPQGSYTVISTSTNQLQILDINKYKLSSAVPDKKYTLDRFGQLIKQKYPQYNDLDNTDLANKVLTKYPQYKDMVSVNSTALTAQSKNKIIIVSVLHFVIFFLIGNLIIIALFEVIRRCFYYIFLGSLRPKK